MEHYHKATFTLPPDLVEVIDFVKKNWKLGKSKTIQVCIENTFKLMQEELEDPDKVTYPKKFKGTVPITVSIPYSVFEKLEYYSNRLDMPKSHLVHVSIKYTLMTVDESKKDLDNEIDELMDEMMDVVSESYTSKIE